MTEKNPVYASRLEDVLMGEVKRIDAAAEGEAKRLDQIMTLRAEHAIQLAIAETKRIDAIRVVDVNAVFVANERATAQASVLANQVSASAEALRALVASTAATQATQLAQLTNQLTERLAAIEKIQNETSRRSDIPPPEIIKRIADLENSEALSKGRSGLSTPLFIVVATAIGGLLIFLIQRTL